MMKSLPLSLDILNQRFQKTFGPCALLTSWQVLTGGARKQVFRLDLAQPFPPVVLLVWLNEHDYFGERTNAESSRSDHQAPLLYRANTDLLTGAGVKVPALYDFDSSCQEASFTFALVEYLEASTFNEWKKGKTETEVQAVLVRIRNYLNKMHSIQWDLFGTLLDPAPKACSCHNLALKEALVELSVLGKVFADVGQNEDRVKGKLECLYNRISSRYQFCFIHDELGPDEHLLIDANDNVAIIDLDGCQFWDLEREYAYLKLRFGEYYASLDREDLDDARMQFYGLCLHISAAHGHYQLYRKGFPDAEMLKSIYEWNLHKMISITVER